MSRRGQPVSLEPKTFDVLRYLIDHRDRLVTKEELLDAVWKNTFVTPNVLTRAVAQLRKALGDDAFEARYIETVAKRGYRFIAALNEPVADHRRLPESAGETVPVQSDSKSVALPARTRHRRVALGVAAAGLAALLAFAAFRRQPAEGPSPAPPLLRRFTVGSQSYTHPSVSPDSRTVAFSSEQSGSAEVYTVGFAPGDRELAITSDGAQNIQPDWSPDGQWIAYHSRTKRGIWIVPAGGGASRQIVDFGSQPAWTADGQRLIFTSDAGGMAAQSLLWSVHRDGSDRHPLTRLGAPRGGHSRPAVSRDGRFVAFTVSQGFGGMDVYVLPLTGGDPVKVGQGIAPAGPAFSADGGRLYWIGAGPDGNDALMMAPIDDSGAPLRSPSTVMSVPGYIIGGLTVANDGTSILSLYSATANLFAVDVGADGQRVPPVQLTFDEVRNSQPRFSSTGRLAFHQFSANNRRTVWSMNDDGSDKQLLTVGFTASVGFPQWAPDGTRLLVLTSEPGRRPSFAWLDAATRRLTSIELSPVGMMNAHLSPDAHEIAFHKIDASGVIDVWRQPIDGAPAHKLTTDPEAVGYPAWSHDGRRLAVEVKRGDTTQIGVITRDGGPIDTLLADKGQNWPHSWAADDSAIAFAGERDGVWNVYTVSVATRKVRQLTHFTSTQGYVRYPAWSPVRPRIVFERAEHRGSLWTTKLW